MSESLNDLIERFRRAGCSEPESWARSEFEEGIPQYARFVFLRELWKMVAPKGSRDWLRHLELPNDDGKGGARRRLNESSASMDDLTELVRCAQAEVVRKVAFLLDGYPSDDGDGEDFTWGLFEVDHEQRPGRAIDGLHESVGDEEFQGEGS